MSNPVVHDITAPSISSAQSESTVQNTPRMPIPPPEVRSDDTVILFMGSTGSGMSNFINKLTGMSKEPDADDLDHYMRSVAAYPCTRANERFIFVDTPGFDSKHYSSLPEVLEVVAEWLEQCGPNVHLSGIIYTRQIKYKYLDTEKASFQAFAKWCQGETAQRVRLVTTMWDDLDAESEGQAVEEDLKTIYWKSLLKEGAGYKRFKNTHQEAWDIVCPLGDQQRAPLLRERLIPCTPATVTGSHIGSFVRWITKLFRCAA